MSELTWNAHRLLSARLLRRINVANLWIASFAVLFGVAWVAGAATEDRWGEMLLALAILHWLAICGAQEWAEYPERAQEERERTEKWQRLVAGMTGLELDQVRTDGEFLRWIKRHGDEIEGALRLRAGRAEL